MNSSRSKMSTRNNRLQSRSRINLQEVKEKVILFTHDYVELLRVFDILYNRVFFGQFEIPPDNIDIQDKDNIEHNQPDSSLALSSNTFILNIENEDDQFTSFLKLVIPGYKQLLEIEVEYGLDEFFCNEFVLLKLKFMLLFAKTINVASFTEEMLAESEITYSQAIVTFQVYLDKLDYRNDLIFQQEMYYYLKMFTKRFVDFSEVDVTYKNLMKDLMLKFSKKCTYQLIRLDMEHQSFFDSLIKNPKDVKAKSHNAAIFSEYMELYKHATINYNKEKTPSIKSKLDYIEATFFALNFLVCAHPLVLNVNPDTIFKFDEKYHSNLNEVFKKYAEFNIEYLDRMTKILFEINITLADACEIIQIRRLGAKVIKYLELQQSRFLKWNEMLGADKDKNEREIEVARNVIVSLYRNTLKIHSFYSTFFKIFPENKRGNLTPIVAIFSIKDDYSQQVKSVDEIVPLLNLFCQQEYVKEEHYQEEKKNALKISNESAKFLMCMQRKEDAFRLKQEKIRLAEEKQKVLKRPIPSDSSSEENASDEFATNDFDWEMESTQVKVSRYFNKADAFIKKHKYTKAIEVYELVRDAAVSEEDVFLQLRALDGLSITYGNIILGNIAEINALLKNRLMSTDPFKAAQQIELENLIKNLIYKLSHLNQLSVILAKLSGSSSLVLDEDVKAGIKFGQTIILELTTYIVGQSNIIRGQYNDLLKKNRLEKEKFILKLGQEEAARLNVKMSVAELKKAGWKKFAELGKNNIQKGKASDHTNEMLLLEELNSYFNLLPVSAVNMLSSTSNMIKPLTQPIEFKTGFVYSQNFIQVNLPDYISEMFSLIEIFSPDYCLFGSTIINILLHMKGNNLIYASDMDFLTTCNNASQITGTGFKQCKYKEDLFFYTASNKVRVDLSAIKDNLIDSMANKIFTVSTLYCKKTNDGFFVFDDTGRGFRDLEQMRLVANGDPVKIFTENPTTILLFIKYCLKGFNPDLNIIHALNKIQPNMNIEKAHFDDIVTKQLYSRDYSARKKYVEEFVKYGLMKKLFNITHEGNVSETLVELEDLYNVPSNRQVDNNIILFSENRSNQDKPRENVTEKSCVLRSKSINLT